MKYLPLVLALAFTPGCNIDSRDTSKAVKDISVEVEKLTKTFGDYVHQAEAPDELKKLSQWEYKILNFAAAIPAEELQAELNEHGKERWECFHAEKLTSTAGPLELMMICKRRPYTPLKYLPKNIVGG